jgi:chromosome partitioning protein
MSQEHDGPGPAEQAQGNPPPPSHEPEPPAVGADIRDPSAGAEFEVDSSTTPGSVVLDQLTDRADAATEDAAQPAFSSDTEPEVITRIMAVANQKGGVGKTTTTVNMGAALAELGHRVLIVDLDPQGNATTGLGINYRVLDHTMYDVLLSGLPIDDCIEPTEVKGLFVAPASLDLAGAEIELVPAFNRESKLKRALEDVSDQYEYILIDCPPSLGLLTVNGLVAASEVLVPIQCEYYALEGLAQLARNVDLVRDNLNPGLRIRNIVMVMYDTRTKLGEQVVEEVRGHFGDRVCRNMIPRNIKLSEAPSYGQPITIYASSSRGAVAYRELAREVSGVS